MTWANTQIVAGDFTGDGKADIALMYDNGNCDMGLEQMNSTGTGFTPAERKAPPAIGAVVTIRHKSRAPGALPREPAFIAERNYE